ncbi:hypothetical protein D9K79_00865 [Acinetobacter cumulans]|uniref:Uncharacterized protein n=1 Tax=Acinetobacter cumulans TaxID=2136182 RepID=A0ABX9UAQ8_9GAMM|nr:hypothetical protein [Acinetobacter cumulans]RLL50334.1 hypothetical protein D9K79_00865 [Acinetobacter cumulans]
MSYVPPNGNKIAFNFKGGEYIRPQGNLVAIEFREQSAAPSETQYIFPEGYTASLFGNSKTDNYITYAFTSGVYQFEAGKPSLKHGQFFIKPSGFNAGRYGTTNLINKNTTIRPTAFNAALYGTSKIFNRTQYIKTSGFNASALGNGAAVVNKLRIIKPSGLDQSLYGKHTSSLGRRYISPAGIKLLNFGNPWLSHKVRLIGPNSILNNFWSSHRVSGSRTIFVAGFEATKFGSRIIPETQTIAPIGMSGKAGTPAAENMLKFVKPLGFAAQLQPEFRFGRAHLYNLVQNIAQYHDEYSELVPPKWPQWLKIENKNKNISAYGFDALRSGTPFIYNNARLLQTKTFNTVSLGKPAISHWRRSIFPDAIEPVYISRWNAVHNGARVITPFGIKPPENTSVQSIVNTRRYYSSVGRISSSEFGQPMISDRIRELTFETRYGIHPPIIQLPVVFNWRSDVQPLGERMDKWGMPDVSIRWNKITPRWIAKDLFGLPDISNLTPELKFRGSEFTEFGLQKVYLLRQDIRLDGFLSQAIGRASIADRKQYLRINGFNAGVFGNKTQIYRANEPAHIDKHINVISIGLTSQVAVPKISQNVLSPMGFDSLKFGSPEVRTNVIEVNAGIKTDDYGVPYVSLKNRLIQSAGNIASKLDFGKPIMSPYTIYASKSATSQAINNNGGTFKYVNSDDENRKPGEVFGLARVWQQEKNNPKTIGIDAFRAGAPRIELKLKYITVPSIVAFRMGVLKVSDGTETLLQFGSADSMVFGEATVRMPMVYNNKLRPSGFALLAMGKPVIEFKHRQVFPQGISSLSMGSSRGLLEAYMPQSLHVGPRMATKPSGFIALRTGTPWVSFKVREIQQTGFDSFRSEYDIEAFAKRMRVQRKDMPKPVQKISVVSTTSQTAAGTPNIRPGAHYIRPDGNSDQFRKGAIQNVE